jgi:hypothetical protein
VSEEILWGRRVMLRLFLEHADASSELGLFALARFRNALRRPRWVRRRISVTGPEPEAEQV